MRPWAWRVVGWHADWSLIAVLWAGCLYSLSVGQDPRPETRLYVVLWAVPMALLYLVGALVLLTLAFLKQYAAQHRRFAITDRAGSSRRRSSPCP